MSGIEINDSPVALCQWTVTGFTATCAQQWGNSLRCLVNSTTVATRQGPRANADESVLFRILFPESNLAAFH